MKRRIQMLASSLMVIMMMLTACSSASTPKIEKYADTIIYADLYTAVPDAPQAQAMAIKNGKILAVGSREEMAEYIGPDTAQEDYTGSFLMPGMIDGHTHLYIKEESNAGDFVLTEYKSAEEYLAVIAEAVDARPNAQMYRGFGWLDSMFVGGTPTAEMLDAVCNTVPIYIQSEDCHSCWVNTRMMELCGITADMENPLGGVIERNEKNEPNGCFRDTAMDILIKPYVMPFSVEEYKEMFLHGQEFYTELGYTALNDVVIDPQEADAICQAYAELEQEGKLLIKVNVSILVNNNENYAENIRHIKTMAEELNGQNFRITDVKFFMDGIVESKTAAVSEPYEGTEDYGSDRWPNQEDMERLYDAVRLCNDLGLTAHFHAIGDAAIRKSLDAIEYAKETSENNDIRNCITHLQMADQDSIARMAELGVTAVCNYGWAPSVSEELGMVNIELLNVGEARNEAMYPFASMLRAGVTVSYATDYPAGPIVSPLLNLQSAIVRQYPKYDTTIRNPEEALTVEQALYGITRGGAWQLNRENEIGSLEPGKDADFILLNQSLLTMEPTQISSSTAVMRVWIGGNAVYTAQ